MKLFISYAHGDRERVRKLVEVFNETGHVPWFDSRLVVGRPWQEQLLEAIRNSDAFVYVMSPASVHSEWCQWEFSQAVRIGKPIIPILLEQTEIPETLGHYQYADFTEGPTPQAVEKLVEGLAGIAVTIAPENAPHAPQNPQGIPAQAMQRRVWTLPVILVIALMAVIAVALILAVMPEPARNQLLYQVGLIPATPTATLTPTITPAPTMTPTPAPGFAPASEGEILLIVSEFEKRDINPFNPSIMFDALQNAVDRARTEHDVPARIERVAFAIHDREQARALADQFGATMVIWGSVDNAGVDTHYEISQQVQSKVLTVVENTTFTAHSTSDEVAIRIRRATDQLYVVDFILGQLLYFDGQYRRAAPLFQDAIQIAQDIPPEFYAELGLSAAHFYLGYIEQVVLEDNQAAADAYTSSLAIDPQSDVAIFAASNRGIADANLGNYEAALEDYKIALALDPDHVDSYVGRGWAYHMLGDEESALKDYAEALARDPENGLAYNDRGISYYSLKQYQDALNDYQQAIAAGMEQLKWPYYNEGLAYYALGRFDDAVMAYSTALAQDPGYSDAFYNRGLTYNDMGRYQEAIADYDQVLALDPGYISAYINRGWSHHLMGDDTQAIDDYQQAIALDPSSGLSYNDRGLSYYVLGKFDEALADFQQAIDLGMDDLKWPYYNRGIVYNALGQYEQALDNYTTAIEIAPDYADAYNNRGWTKHLMGNDAAAVEDYSRALEIQPDFALAYNNRGMSYYGLGNYEAALADYRSAAGISPDNADSYWGSGNALYQLGRFDEALADYQHYLDLSGDQAALFVRVRAAMLEATLTPQLPDAPPTASPIP